MLKTISIVQLTTLDRILDNRSGPGTSKHKLAFEQFGYLLG